jgi:hypothetical protein
MAKRGARVAGRLTDKEADKFLDRARKLLEHGRVKYGRHMPSDFMALGLTLPEDYENALRTVLNEVTGADYCGPHPPNHIAGEPGARGARMLQFVKTISHRRMYLKFVLKKGRDGDQLVVLRLHEAYDPNVFARKERDAKNRMRQL